MQIERGMSLYAILGLVSIFLFGCSGGEQQSAPPQVQQAPKQVEAPAKQATVASQVGTEDEEDEDALALWAEAEPEFGDAPLTVKFTVESLAVDNLAQMKGVKYEWDFGDGSPKSTEASPTHTYEKPGEYTVTVRADVGGQKGWDEFDIDVSEREG
jgi:PKD repeat protein